MMEIARDWYPCQARVAPVWDLGDISELDG